MASVAERSQPASATAAAPSAAPSKPKKPEKKGEHKKARPPAPRPPCCLLACPLISASLLREHASPLLRAPAPLCAHPSLSLSSPPTPPLPPHPLPSPTPPSPTPHPPAVQGSLLGDFDIDEDSGVPVGEQLRMALVAKAGRVIDLFREWDADGDGAWEPLESTRHPYCLPLPFTLTTHHSPLTTHHSTLNTHPHPIPDPNLNPNPNPDPNPTGVCRRLAAPAALPRLL